VQRGPCVQRGKGRKGHRHPEYGVRKRDGGEAEGGVWKIETVLHRTITVNRKLKRVGGE